MDQSRVLKAALDTAKAMVDERDAILKLLEDVPDETALEKVTRLKKWYLELFNDGAKGP